ncbi:MAG: hypothetical protein ACK4PR_08195 [Gammaproteobacteria bacterium]
MFKIKKILLAISIVLLAGCSQSPLSKLKSDREYPFMDNAYWMNQEHENPTEWQQAVTYCRANHTKPNCSPVLFRANLEDSIKADKNNSGGESINLPWETKKSWQMKK